MKNIINSNDFQVKNKPLEKQYNLKQDLIKFLNEVINPVDEDNKKTIIKADKLIKRINKIL